MKYFKIKYSDGNSEIVSAENSLAVIKKYSLCTREHIDTRVIELSGEQEAIAKSNEEQNKYRRMCLRQDGIDDSMLTEDELSMMEE